MSSLLTVSFIFNCLLLAAVIFLVIRHKPGKAKKPELTKDASNLLSDLLRGGSVVVTQVVNPDDIFFYSPKDQIK